MKCIESMKLAARRFSVPVSAAVVSLASAGVAFADGEPLINFEDLTTTVQTDVTTAITAMLPFLGLLCGAIVGWRIFRKFTGART